jgi:hypothetical protein
MRVPWWKRLGLLLLLLLLAGCGQRVQAPVEPNYRLVSGKDVPAAIAAQATRSPGVPGVWFLEQDGQTYLLVQAGEVEAPRTAIRVMEVRTEPDSQSVRILARVEPDPQGNASPSAVLAVEAKAKRWVVRLAHMAEEPLELQGMKVSG